ncbi:Acyl-CoA dehydrogenase [Nonomuraea solani]|uniref:Acyl-CoA dehydrogenase n=1 Tax=Nonomuraea solani TaxID=1144553 RepID=A0A1H5T3C6_9ACTN|nr:acyl-CoA dehydrogenase family protein [Nonomuraea solani]SEF57313.1 Acyl-CoA dehydrogenase [Nonomuraea solani]
MNFGFTEEQLALAETVCDVLRAHCPAAALRGERRPAWKELAGLGFFGLLAPAEAGGLGLGLADVVPALEETGRACLPGPVAETVVAAAYLPGAASGELCVGIVPAGQDHASDADLADLIVVARDDGLRVVARESARLVPRRGPDSSRPLFEVSFEASEPLSGSVEAISRRITVATSAQLIGVARELLAVTVGYARVRTQFGAAIGSFQAVKHQLADVAVAVEFAAPLVWRAALSVDGDVPTADRDVSAAKAAAGEAATLAARVALQVHGAIGYTEELDLRFWLARAWSLSAAYGTTAAHRERLRHTLTGGDLGRYP